MRSPFNAYCEIFAGPGTSTPGLSRGIHSCRLVIEDGIHSQQFEPGQPRIPAYLTIESYRPLGMFLPPNYTVLSSLADRVAIPASGPVNYMVFYTDFIIWKRQRKYFRAYLIEIPSPDVTFGGVVVNGLAVISPPHTVTAGGVACGGSGQPILIGLGEGVEIGGMAVIIPSSPLFSIGGVQLGGVGLVVPGGVTHPIGGVLIGGVTDVRPGRPFTTVGGVLLNGSGTVAPNGGAGIHGGVLLGGVATIIPGTVFVAGGGVLIGGAGSYQPAGISGYYNGGPTATTPVGVDIVLVDGTDSFMVSGDRILTSGWILNPLLNGTWTLTKLSGALAYTLNGSTAALVPNPGLDTGSAGAKWFKI